jgi:hypothetical protein
VTAREVQVRLHHPSRKGKHLFWLQPDVSLYQQTRRSDLTYHGKFFLVPMSIMTIVGHVYHES